MRDERKRESFFIRLAIVLVLMLVGRLLWPRYEEPLRPYVGPVIQAVNAIERRVAEWSRSVPAAEPPARPAEPRVAAPRVPDLPPPVPLDPPAPAAKEPAKPAAAPSPAAPEPAATPAPQVAARTPAAPEADKELAAAKARMVAAPPGLPEALLRVDPRALASLMERGTSAYNDAPSPEERVKAARMIFVAAALGYGPARTMIVRSYPRSRALRTVASANDVVRFALDAFAASATPSESSSRAFATLASYFAAQGKAEELASALIDSLSDDRRMHEIPRMEPMFDALNDARGVCKALATAVKAPAGVIGGLECLPTVKAQMLEHVRKAPIAGRDEAARRRALGELKELTAAR